MSGLAGYLDGVRSRIDGAACFRLEGRVSRVTGVAVESIGPPGSVGDACELIAPNGTRTAGRIVGFAGATALLDAVRRDQGICEGSPVVPRASASVVPFGEALLGRVVNAAMRPPRRRAAGAAGESAAGRRRPRGLARERICRRWYRGSVHRRLLTLDAGSVSASSPAAASARAC